MFNLKKKRLDQKYSKIKNIHLKVYININNRIIYITLKKTRQLICQLSKGSVKLSWQMSQINCFWCSLCCSLVVIVVAAYTIIKKMPFCIIRKCYEIVAAYTIIKKMSFCIVRKCYEIVAAYTIIKKMSFCIVRKCYEIVCQRHYMAKPTQNIQYIFFAS